MPQRSASPPVAGSFTRPIARGSEGVERSFSMGRGGW
jgi:hypothetical protein